jgi:hypothetical protein
MAGDVVQVHLGAGSQKTVSRILDEVEVEGFLLRRA